MQTRQRTLKAHLANKTERKKQKFYYTRRFFLNFPKRQVIVVSKMEEKQLIGETVIVDDNLKLIELIRSRRTLYN